MRAPKATMTAKIHSPSWGFDVLTYLTAFGTTFQNFVGRGGAICGTNQWGERKDDFSTAQSEKMSTKHGLGTTFGTTKKNDVVRVFPEVGTTSTTVPHF